MTASDVGESQPHHSGTMTASDAGESQPHHSGTSSRLSGRVAMSLLFRNSQVRWCRMEDVLSHMKKEVSSFPKGRHKKCLDIFVFILVEQQGLGGG